MAGRVGEQVREKEGVEVGGEIEGEVGREG